MYQDGYRTIDEIKRVTRAGMGPCQGRTCRMLIAQELSSYYKLPLEEVLMPTFRPPVKPISMGALADAWEETVRDGDEGSYGSYDPSATKRRWLRMKKAYDVIIIGGGIIGCATAFELAKRGITDILLIEKRFLTSGATGRCGAGIRQQWGSELTRGSLWKYPYL